MRQRVKRNKGKGLMIPVMKAMKKTPRMKKGIFHAPCKASNKQPLRNLEQPSYTDVAKWTEPRCKKYLVASGVLPKISELKTRRSCWSCHEKLKFISSASGVCTKKKCTKGMKATRSLKKVMKCAGKAAGTSKPQLRCNKAACNKRIVNAAVAYTPLWPSAAGETLLLLVKDWCG